VLDTKIEERKFKIKQGVTIKRPCLEEEKNCEIFHRWVRFRASQRRGSHTSQVRTWEQQSRFFQTSFCVHFNSPKIFMLDPKDVKFSIFHARHAQWRHSNFRRENNGVLKSTEKGGSSKKGFFLWKKQTTDVHRLDKRIPYQ